MDVTQMNALLAELKAGAALASRSTLAPQSGQKVAAPSDFSAVLKGALEQVNEVQSKSDTLAREFQLGNPGVSLEETLIAGQKSSLSFQFLLQVRNKVLTAYNDIMNMPM